MAVRRWLGLILVLLGLTLLAWGNWPAIPETLVEISLRPEEMSFPQTSSDTTPVLSPLRGRKLILTAPRLRRKGDDITLKLELVEDTQAASPEQGDIYQTYNLVAAARLELEGQPFAPTTEMYSPVQPGESVEFSWQVRPSSTLKTTGTTWLHFDYFPILGKIDKSQLEPFTGFDNPELDSVYGSQVATRQMVAAPKFSLKFSSLFGLGGTAARVVGGLSLVFGIVLVLGTWLTHLLYRSTRSEAGPHLLEE